MQSTKNEGKKDYYVKEESSLHMHGCMGSMLYYIMQLENLCASDNQGEQHV